MTAQTATTARHAHGARERRLRWRLLWEHGRGRPIHAAGAVVLLTMVVLALAEPWLPLPDPHAQDLLGRLQPPMSRSADGTLHLAGTDQLGRDVLARTILGARISLGIAVVTVIVSGIVGSVAGLVAGYRGGPFDHVVMRLVDFQMAFPTMLFAIFLLYLLGASLLNLVILLAALSWISYARMARAQTLTLREQVFVESALALGCTNRRVLFRHILPHLLPVLLVIAVFDFATVMLAEAGLSFLGLGVQPPSTSWGRLVADGQAFIYTGGWWLFLVPGLAIFLAVLSARLSSAWVQEWLGPSARGGR